MKSHLRKTLATALLLWSLSGTAQAAEYYICDGAETLGQVAEQTGVDVELLAAANDAAAADSPLAGALLRLPTELALAVTVQAGDTLWSLARAWNIPLAEVLAYNEEADPQRLQVGQTVYLPLDEEAASGSGGAEVVALAAPSLRPLWLSWPALGVITSYFGEKRDSGYHSGLDVANDGGTPIQAAAAGQVLEAGWKNDAYGWTVMIDHGQGLLTLYAHCQELLVKAGQQVRKGEDIAAMGSTGNSTGPHVHFEVRVDHICQDPLTYLPL